MPSEEPRADTSMEKWQPTRLDDEIDSVLVRAQRTESIDTHTQGGTSGIHGHRPFRQ